MMYIVNNITDTHTVLIVIRIEYFKNKSIIVLTQYSK